ncbi:MAG: Sugar diacid utilization regulator [Lachnospiraceae bacterium]|jgi:carbohydrate diacid regulator|nr:Sugar diacid utilization regulator [Lachnospiraceae bacterium]
MITKINKKLAQQIVNTVKDVCGQDVNFIDASGIIFASTNETRIGDFHEIGFQVAKTRETIEVAENNSFQGTQMGVNLPIFHNGSLISVIGISGNPDNVRKFAYLAIRITKLLIREQEIEAYNRSQQDKMNYIVRSLVKGEITNRDYLSECISEMRIDETEKKCVIIVKLNSRYNIMNVSLIEQNVIQMFYSINASLYSYNYPNEYIAIISKKPDTAAVYILTKFAEEHKRILSIGVGSRQTLYHLDQSYEAGKIALKSLEGTENCYSDFDELDIEIVLGNLDQKSRDEYLQKTISLLSEEDKTLLKVYYKENMSLSQTCNRLFLHKNTLQYKLDRINKITGYNPRKFKDAVVLYIALIL